jgi:hypothetical protein
VHGHVGTSAPLRFRTSTNILDLLGVQLYSSVPKAISELIVNGYDADATYVTVCSSSNDITVEDNGDAMDEAAIRNQYMFLGSRHKRAQAVTPGLHRRPIGAKGIGKLAGLGIARRIEIESWRDGVAHSWVIDRDEMERASGKDSQGTLDRAAIPFSTARTERTGSGTRVRLSRLRPEIHFDAKRLRQHLAQELPLSEQFQVVVDGQKIKRSDTPGRAIAIRHTDPVCGLIEGKIVIARKRVTPPGVMTTVRGRAVGGPSFFDLDVSARRYHSTDFITGQVECGGLDADDGATSAIKTDREGFIVNHPAYVAFARFMSEQIYRVAKEIEDEADKRHDDDRREKLTEAVRNTTDVLNAWNRDQARRMQLAASSKVPAHRDPTGVDVGHPVVDATDRDGVRPRGPEHEPEPPEQLTPIQVLTGTGKLRLKNQVFEVKVWPLGEAAPECEIRRDEAVIVVNESHPTYEEALRNRWTDVVVLRAVAARFACDTSATAAEAYEVIDDILRFAAERAKKRRAGTIEDEQATDLAPAV